MEFELIIISLNIPYYKENILIDFIEELMNQFFFTYELHLKFKRKCSLHTFRF